MIFLVKCHLYFVNLDSIIVIDDDFILTFAGSTTEYEKIVGFYNKVIGSYCFSEKSMILYVVTCYDPY